jgi:lipopolysaccharide/colanic/teichoic acid biosynthesis glycosyltransferase
VPHDSISVSRTALDGLTKSSIGSYHLDHLTDFGAGTQIAVRRRRELVAGLKRAADVTGAIVLLTTLTPLLLVVALLIKLSSRGPVIFTQMRPGKDLIPFPMFKFRTMKASDDFEQEEERRMKNGEFFKDADDPRITTLGRFLRRTSIDELPQLVNVLRGEMSLVGPRPILNCEVGAFERALQRYRFSIKPGLTGLWQVSGRSDTSSLQRLTYDVEYVRNWSLLLDLKLLLRTIPAVLRSEGAK